MSRATPSFKWLDNKFESDERERKANEHKSLTSIIIQMSASISQSLTRAGGEVKCICRPSTVYLEPENMSSPEGIDDKVMNKTSFPF